MWNSPTAGIFLCYCLWLLSIGGSCKLREKSSIAWASSQSWEAVVMLGLDLCLGCSCRLWTSSDPGDPVGSIALVLIPAFQSFLLQLQELGPGSWFLPQLQFASGSYPNLPPHQAFLKWKSSPLNSILQSSSFSPLRTISTPYKYCPWLFLKSLLNKPWAESLRERAVRRACRAEGEYSYPCTRSCLGSGADYCFWMSLLGVGNLPL